MKRNDKVLLTPTKIKTADKKVLTEAKLTLLCSIDSL